MLTVTDSFIKYLSTGLENNPPVHWRRQDPNDENADMFRHGYLNVKSLGFFEEGSVEHCLISLDLLGSNERVVLAQVQATRDLLLSEQIISEFDYTIPSIPTDTGRSVSWDAREIRFINVRVPTGQRYVHFNATFPVTHTRE
jgi:hypothetical protein